MKTDIVTNPMRESEQHISAPQSLVTRLKRRLRGRRPLLLAGITMLAAGMALNWDWLTAMGAAPIILSLAPCALMCTVGICCIKGGNQP